MKKTLLLTAVAAMALSASAQDGTDVTPANYHFNTATTIPWFNNGVGTVQGSGKGIQTVGANYQAANGGIWEGFDCDPMDYWDGGLIGIVSAGGLNPEQVQNLLAGCSLVDLGGEVGQVFCWQGDQSDLIDELTRVYPNKAEQWSKIPKSTGQVGGWNFNFFMDPQDVHCKDAGYYRFRMVFNVLHTPDENNGIYRFNGDQVFQNIYQVNNQGNNTSFVEGGPAAGQSDATLVPAVKNNLCVVRTASGGIKEDEYGDPIWDPTQWIQLDYYFNVAGNDKGLDSDGKSTVPVRIKAQVAAAQAWRKLAVLIKDISITKFEGTLPRDLYNVGSAAPSMVTLDPTKTTGIGEVAAEEAPASYTINGNTVTFSAPAVVFNLVGQKVAEGTQATLAGGVYVAKVGTQSVKFVVR